MTLASLITRLEGAGEGSRELDLAIGVALCGWTIEPTFMGMKGPWVTFDGGTCPATPGGDYPALTQSLDAALALAGRVLPGWSWSGGQITKDGTTQAWAVVYSTDRGKPVGSELKAPTPALALVLATLRAVQGRGGVE